MGLTGGTGPEGEKVSSLRAADFTGLERKHSDSNFLSACVVGFRAVKDPLELQEPLE